MKNTKLTWILFGAFLLLSVLSYFVPLTLWDENAYLGNARAHISSSNYTEDFRYPLLEYVISALWMITGESIFAARILMVLFYAMTIFLFYLVTKPLLKHNILLTALFAISPQMIYWGFRIYTDVFVVFFILLSLYLLQKNRYLLCGIAAGLAVLAKFTSILLIPAIFIALLANKKIKKSILFTSGIIIALLPWMIFNQINYSNPLWDFFAQLDLVNRYNTFMSPWLFIKDLLIYGNIFLIMAAVKIKEIARKKEFLPMLIFTSVYIAYMLFFSEVKFARYLLSIIPFVYLFGWSAIENIKNKKVQKYVICSAVLFSVLLFIGAIAAITAEFSCASEGSTLKAINYLKNESNSDIDIISNLWPWYGYYNNARVHSFYSNIPELIETHNPRYFVYNKGLGDPYDEKEFEKLKLEIEVEGKCNEKTTIFTK